MKSKTNQSGFTYIETVISLVIITVGMLGAISALTWGVFYMQSAEKRTKAKEIANSTIESVFAVRDINSQEKNLTGTIGFTGWNLIQTYNGTNTGVFANGWFPVRNTPGTDGLIGTIDDSCPAGSSCGGNAEIPGYERQIVITDIVENGLVRKRQLTVSVRYNVGTLQRIETISTIIANLPFK